MNDAINKIDPDGRDGFAIGGGHLYLINCHQNLKWEGEWDDGEWNADPSNGENCELVDLGPIGMIPGDLESPCDRARASAAKFYKLANDTRTDFEDRIKHIGQQLGQSAAVDSWLNELHSDNNAVDNAIEVADHLGQILRTAASAYANGKKDIHRLNGSLTEWIRAFTYSLSAAEKVKTECNDSSDYDHLLPAKEWNEAFYEESGKIVEDILKDWKPPH